MTGVRAGGLARAPGIGVRLRVWRTKVGRRGVRWAHLVSEPGITPVVNVWRRVEEIEGIDDEGSPRLSDAQARETSEINDLGAA